MGTPIAEARRDVNWRKQVDQHQASASRGLHSWRTLAATLALSLSLTGAMATPVGAADVLILLPTVVPSGAPPGSGSTEYKIITTPAGTPVPGFPSVMGLGLTADIVPATGPVSWTTPPQPYSAYRAIVLGDPNCQTTTAPLAAAEANATGATGWTAAVKGNVVIIGTDPTVHPGINGVSGAQLWHSAIKFAVAGAVPGGPGPGAVIALSCYYNGAPSGTLVPVLKGFESTGVFKVQGGIPCAGDVAIVAASPALTGLTGGPGGTLSAWGCSVHEGFNSWDPSFIPLAIATDVAPALKTYPVAAPKGFPYILARGKDLTVVEDGGILKVCKVAGVGVAVGTPFTFTAGGTTFTVPAGPGPGGTCVVGPTLPVGSTVTVDEAVPPGHLVSSIAVAPPSHLVGAPNLAAGSVDVTIGIGVTEVTFTDKRTGFVEICKKGDVTGTFKFTVNPGGLGPFVVPAGACSPAIEVAAGTVVIQETPSPGIIMAGCSTIPAGQQGPCNLGVQSSTVAVVPGDVSTQTIAFITNRRGLTGASGAIAPLHVMGDMASARPAAIGTAATTVSCAPNAAPLGRPVTCTAKMGAVPPTTGTPTGDVSFRLGNTTLAKVQVSSDGTAAFTTATLAVGTHPIVAAYSGDDKFEPNVSQQFTVTVAQP